MPGEIEPEGSDDALTPDAIVTSGEQLFPYDKGQAPAAEAVKRRRRWLPGGRRRGTGPSTQREQERGPRR